MPATRPTTPKLDQLSDTFRRYAAWNKRESEELLADQARKLATELYTQTAAIAPTREEIAADVRALGWKIPKWFSTGGKRGWRFGRGKVESWTRKKKDGMTLEQVQAKVISIRANHARFLASGWLGAIVAMGGKPKASTAKIDMERGGAEIHRGTGVIEIVLWNRTEGIKLMDDKRHFVSKAVAVRVADMWVYIARKMEQSANEFFEHSP